MPPSEDYGASQEMGKRRRGEEEFLEEVRESIESIMRSVIGLRRGVDGVGGLGNRDLMGRGSRILVMGWMGMRMWMVHGDYYDSLGGWR